MQHNLTNYAKPAVRLHAVVRAHSETMNTQIAIGGALVALPFVAITVGMIASIGWREMLCVWGITIAITACISAGCILLTRHAP